MLQRFLGLGVGALALLGMLGAPGPAHAQHMRGGGPHMARPAFRGPMMMPGFRGGFDHRFDRGFNSRFDRRFDSRFDRRFDRFEDRSNRGSFFAPRLVPGFGPTFMRPF